MTTSIKRAAMVVLCSVVIAVICLAGVRGTAPRTQASRYPAHAAHDGAQAGALLLTAEQTRRAFTTDVARCCVVVEVAIYPESGKPLEILPVDFTLRVTGTDIAAKPSSARLLAATLQKTAPTQRDITLYPQVGIGYESGPRVYDPVTGEHRGGGLRTSAGVGVGVGESRPASTDRDRDVMELELEEKGLPEGRASAPVAGYLYFPFSLKKRPATFQLEYTLNGGRVTLRLP